MTAAWEPSGCGRDRTHHSAPCRGRFPNQPTVSCRVVREARRAIPVDRLRRRQGRNPFFEGGFGIPGLRRVRFFAGLRLSIEGAAEDRLGELPLVAAVTTTSPPPGWRVCSLLAASLACLWPAACGQEPERLPQVVGSERLAASASRIERLLEQVSLQVPAEVAGSVGTEIRLGRQASPSRLLQACRDLQDASAGQLMPEIRPLFAGLRDHALLLGDPAEMEPSSEGESRQRTNVFIDLPVVPLPTLADRPFERQYNVVRAEDGVRITSRGKGQMVLGLRIEEAKRGVAMHVSLAGTGRANLHGRRGRVVMEGLLHSNLSAETLVQVDGSGLRHAPPRVSVDNQIDLVAVAFQGRLPLVSQLGSRAASRRLDRLMPELTSRSEHEMRRQVISESGRLLDDASGRIEATASPIIRRLGDEAGISLTLGGTAVDAGARIALLADIDSALPASGPALAPPVTTAGRAGRLEIHLHESLPTRLADLAGGTMLLETDFRELCLEPLGLVPEFDPEVRFGGEAARVRLAVIRPVTVSFHERAFSVDVRLDSYQTGGSEPAGGARIFATYAIETNGDSLALRREGQPRGQSSVDDPALEDLAKRFFPARAVSTDVSLLKELLRSVSMTMRQLNAGPEWLGIEIDYAPEDLAIRLGELMR